MVGEVDIAEDYRRGRHLNDDEFGLSQSKLMILDIGHIRCLINVIDSKSLERDSSEKPDPLFRVPL
jgi:hypothetical protein